jgi:hypothetical protein
MNLKKCDAAAIAALVIFMAGSPIVANQAFAISSIAKIIDSVVVGPCTQESGKFMYFVGPLAADQWISSKKSASKR